MSHHIVHVKNLQHVYPDQTVALQEVSFLIHHGESVGIIGANGAGKSTLLLHLNGYLAATSGEIIIGDDTLSKETLPEIRRTVGMVFQDPEDQLFMPTVFDDVAFGPLNMGLSHEEIEARVTEALERVDAVELRNKPPYHLSGGEKKRHEIMQLELLKPKMAILDETDSGLDVDALRIVSEGVNRAKAANNLGVILITHYTRILQYIKPDFVHVFANGRIVEQGGPELADKLEAQGYAEYVTA